MAPLLGAHAMFRNTAKQSSSQMVMQGSTDPSLMAAQDVVLEFGSEYLHACDGGCVTPVPVR